MEEEIEVFVSKEEQDTHMLNKKGLSIKYIFRIWDICFQTIAYIAYINVRKL